MLLNMNTFTRIFTALVLVMGTTFFVVQSYDARADSNHDRDRGTVTHPKDAKWKGECGACHVAYPPRFLPVESWRAIMSGLDKHFGSNATMDAADMAEISAFLEKNAQKIRREDPIKPLLRITETSRFKSEHREISAHTWKNPKIKSPANCGACHPKAENDDFSEDDVKIPR